MSHSRVPPIVHAAGLRQTARADARKYGIPADVFEAQINTESHFDPNAKSPAGAEGIAQFIPSTAAGFHIDPMNPVQALDAAARYDSQLVHKYGSIERALSAYNSGRPDAYKDPNFAGGQTFNYVRSILGADTHAGGRPQPTAPSLQGAQPAAGNPFIQALLSGIDSKGQISPGGILAAVRAKDGYQAALGSPRGPRIGGKAGQGQSGLPPLKPSGKLTALDGIMVDPAISGQVESIEQRFGVHPTSGYRSPAHNAQVGGAENSDHLRGDAVDFTGTPQEMQMLYQWATRNRAIPYVEPMSQAKNHVHLSFIRP